ncbi:hypothetical protein [Actinomadura oligospora]|nr:hypothetical protein [Actinomadura oligospora]
MTPPDPADVRRLHDQARESHGAWERAVDDYLAAPPARTPPRGRDLRR